MTLLFFKSKYTFNNWKHLNEVKNYDRLKPYAIFKIQPKRILVVAATIIFLKNSKYLFKYLINENNLIKERFEEKKIKQISFDYMIFTMAAKDQLNEINKLSLFT